MARLIKSNQVEEIVTPANGVKFTLEEMQKYVGGYIQIIGLPDGRQLIMNEDGKQHDLPFNRKASLLGKLAGILPGDFVVGDVLVASPTEAGFNEEDDEY